MTPVEMKDIDISIAPEGAQIYISQMLEELSEMAQMSGLKELASLLRATVAASKVDLTLEAES